MHGNVFPWGRDVVIIACGGARLLAAEDQNSLLHEFAVQVQARPCPQHLTLPVTHTCTHTCAQVVFLRLHLLATFVKKKAWHLIYRQRCFLIAWRKLSCSSSFVPFFGPSRHWVILYYLAFLHCAHITISLSTRPVLFIFTAVTPAIITSFHLVFEFRTHTFLKLTWTRILKMRLKKLRCCRGLWWCDWKFDFGCKSYLTMVRPKVIKQRNQMRQIKDVASKHRRERETRWNLKAYSKISHFLTCGFLIQMFSSSCHDMNSLRSVPVIQCS